MTGIIDILSLIAANDFKKKQNQFSSCLDSFISNQKDKLKCLEALNVATGQKKN